MKEAGARVCVGGHDMSVFDWTCGSRLFRRRADLLYYFITRIRNVLEYNENRYDSIIMHTRVIIFL